MVDAVNRSFFGYIHLSLTEEVDPVAHREWLNINWKISVYSSMVYLLVILCGEQIMKHRRPFDLRKMLIFWNLCLSVFSIAGMINTVYGLGKTIYGYGLVASVCHNWHTENDSNMVFWSWMFALSKLVELGDTMFVVLRKQPLRFLHYYHHITVLLFVWFSLLEVNSPAVWYMTMNYTVHSLMYTYYCLKAARISVPKRVSMVITLLQLSQMMLGLVLNLTCYRVKFRGDYCGVPYRTLHLSMLMYFSYFLLFLKFFFQSYMEPKVEGETKKVKSQ